MDEFALKLSDSMTLDDLRKPEEWFKTKNKRAITAAEKSRSRHRAASAPVVKRASQVYSSGKSSRLSETKHTKRDALSLGRSEGSLPPSVDLDDVRPPAGLQQESLADGDSAVLNARSGIQPDSPREKLLSGTAASDAFNKSMLGGSVGASVSHSPRSRSRTESAPATQPVGSGQPRNFATSSLAYSGNGGMQLAGLSGMFGPASMPDLTRHDPREAGRALLGQSPKKDDFVGAVTNANRKEVLKTFFKEDVPPPIQEPLSSTLPLGVAPRDPYMGAGSASGYGIGHEVRLAQRSAASYGSDLAARKVAGEQIWMYEEDEAERNEEGWDPAQVGKQRLSETYLQTGTGLKRFEFRGKSAASTSAVSQALTAPLSKPTDSDSLVAPRLTAASSQRIASANAAAGGSKALRSMIGAQLGATPLGSDPRAANFKPHASIAKSKPNKERRRKLAKQGPIKGPLPKQKGPVSAYDVSALREQASNRRKGAPVKEYDAGGKRGLGAGMGKGSVQVPYQLKDSSTADGTLLTSERLQEMVTAFETGSEIQRLRRELEEARSSMQRSENILQASARDWRSEQQRETQQLVAADLTALSTDAGNVHSRFGSKSKK